MFPQFKTNTWSSFETASVIHAGDNDSIAFIKVFEINCKNNGLHLEYRTFEENQNKALLIMQYLDEYKKMELPILVIMTPILFRIIWITTYKDKFVKNVSNYSPMVHVWLEGMDFKKMRTYSSLLCWKHGPFQRYESSEFKDKTSLHLLIIESLTTVKKRKKKDVRYCIEDEKVHSFSEQFLKELRYTPEYFHDIGPTSSLPPMASPSAVEIRPMFASLPPLLEKDGTQPRKKSNKKKRIVHDKPISGCTDKT